HFTHDAIVESEYQALLQALNSIIPEDSHDNDIVADTRNLPANKKLGLKKDSLVYRARNKGKIFAVAFPVTAPDGYSGPINLLLAIDRQGKILGVRVVSHLETPGLGDRIESRRSNWLQQFPGKSVNMPSTAKWKVKKDGGIFDQFTGATITPRKIVKAIHKALVFTESDPGVFFDE
ncbi:MAG: electron transport complex subunit RsxG, partial [Gammaproteobacteria bacterium]|nr:electron transport complex subunit RsxG [Gammaproteobacteria bacterium]